MIDEAQNKPSQSAWVVFNGQADLFWLKILKPGYRHCSVLLNDGAHWITVDPLSNYTDVMVHNLPGDFDLPLWLKDRGYVVAPAPLLRPLTPAPMAMLSCVGSVKRILGIRKRFIFTPWQLFKYLKKSALGQQTNPTHPNQKGDLAWEV
ncbi:MAG: hypothetical protein KDJ35_02615 [Alphaproteobacteria bacterium]|nr:hypothetical protein [Alphaproteobacteria bacterium]